MRDLTVIDWLLDADPSIRRQVMRDLTYEPADVIAAERSRIAIEGWGARLLRRSPPPDGRRRGHAEPVEHTPLATGARLVLTGWVGGAH